MADTPKFSDRLRTFRKRFGFRQEDVAQMLGVTTNYVGMLENGQKPSGSLLKLFDILEREAEERQKASTLTPRALMRQARISKGWSYKELAKHSGCRADVLQAIEEGTGQAPEKVLEKIAMALGLEKEVLMAGQDANVVRNHVEGTYGAKPEVEVIGGGKVKYVPLISQAQAGTMAATTFTDEAYKGEGVLAFDVKDPKAFGVRITGDSMEKRYPAGCTAILYPSSKPVTGDIVVARLREESGGGVMFKYFTSKNAGRKVILSSENPTHPTVEYDAEEFVWIYPVSDVVMNVRRR